LILSTAALEAHYWTDYTSYDLNKDGLIDKSERTAGFQKARKKMADDNKPIKYLRYAIGEILLVVVGILIALQINNWSETEKNKLIEYNYLKEMLEDFEKNNQKSQETILLIEEDLPTLIGLLEQSVLESSTISVDSINSAFSRINYMPSYSSTDRVDDFGIPSPAEKSKILEVLGDRKFRNIITLKWTILTDLLDQNRNLERLNTAMIKRLKVLTNDNN